MIQARRGSLKSARLATVPPVNPPDWRPSQMSSRVSVASGSMGPVGTSGAGGNSYPRKFRSTPRSLGSSGSVSSPGSVVSAVVVVAAGVSGAGSAAVVAGTSASSVEPPVYAGEPVPVSLPEQAAAASTVTTSRPTALTRISGDLCVVETPFLNRDFAATLESPVTRDFTGPLQALQAAGSRRQ